MNGRTLFATVCFLFAIGIVWMIVVTPKGETTKQAAELFEPVLSPSEEVVVASSSAESSQQEEPTAAEEEAPLPSEKQEPAEEEPEPVTAQVPSDEPPELVEYTPKYGRVAFTHMVHVEEYAIDCADCHHEAMEGGMSKCANCHTPPKEAFHKNCIGCHKELEKQGKDTGPVKCRECHIKETG